MSQIVAVYAFVGVLVTAAMLVGGLLASGALVAPVAVRVLPEADAGRFLRAFWPRYYRLGTLGGLALTLACGLGSPATPLGSAYGVVLTALAGTLTIALWLSLRMIPAINARRDAGDARGFERMHRVVLALTASAVLAGIAFLGALAWVVPAMQRLPGH